MKVLHVTAEMYGESFGGVGPILSILYENKNENEEFLFCKIYTTGQGVKNFPKDIHVSSIAGIVEKIKEINPDRIIFHTDLIAYTCIDHFEDKDLWVVAHSNARIEKLYGSNNFSEFAISAFDKCLKKVRWIAISNQEKEILVSQKADPRKIYVCYNGFNFSNNYDIFERQSFYGYIGRLSERKGVFNLASIFSRIDKQLILATGELNIDREYLNSLTKMLAICSINSNNVIPIGFSMGKRRDNFYKSIQALIVPSLYEPFGMIYLEAIDLLTPIIAHRTNSAEEILGKDYPFFFNILDRESLIQCIEKFESYSKNEIEEFCIELKKKKSKEFSVERMILGYRNLPLN